MSGPKKRAAAADRTNGPTVSKPPAAQTGTAATGAPAEGALPLFYRAPHPVTKERHGEQAIRRDANFGFAAGANSVPLNAAEFPLAARHYPVLFTGGEPAIGIALLGLRDNQNLFVGADGAWETGAYVPAYVRRYPFIFMAGGEDGRYILCLDEDAEVLASDDDGHKLFIEGEPMEFTTRALDFCTAYQQQSDYTRKLGGLLAEHGLLIANRANVTLKSGESLALGGFRMIDGKALDALDDAAFLELRRAGALPLIYAQIFSTSNWAALVARDAAPG
ncbi:MAG TPA: SapC family protein [Alphaproteobacteria bacterium]|nr:SapC family protein [Alphaproteobacteria bacterium]